MNVDELYQLGFEARCNGEYGKAKLYFGSVLSQAPDHAEARWQMALVKGFEGDFDGSLADLDALAKQFPTNLAVRYDLAMTQMMLGMVDEACANFGEIDRIAPDSEFADKARKQMAYC